MTQQIRFRRAALGLLLAALGAGEAAALTHSRAMEWSFPNGNAIANWSFENTNAFWDETTQPGCVACTIDPHWRGEFTGGGRAPSGAFVGRVEISFEEPTSYSFMKTQPLRLASNRMYTLSFYHQGYASGPVGAIAKFTSGDPSLFMWPSVGPDLQNDDLGWNLYTFNFWVPTGADETVIALFSTEERQEKGTGFFNFDDVVLEEGYFDAAQAVENRKSITRTVAFGDAFGRTHQSQVGLPGGGNLVSGAGFNSIAQSDTSFLPFPVPGQKPDFQTNLLSQAKAAYTGAVDGRPDAGGHPLSRRIIALEPTGRVTETSSPGNSWRIGGGHTVKTGYFFTNTLTPPADLAAPPACADEYACDKRVDWVQDKNGEMEAAWTDLDLGLLLRKGARYKGAGGATAWSFTDFQYYPDGKPKTSVSPLDGAGGVTTHSGFTQYTASGRILSTYDSDRGVTRLWYNREGKLRFSLDARRKAANEYVYYDYDALGRLRSQGTQVIANMTQAIADQDDYTAAGDGKTERIGYIYDTLAVFSARTGITLSTVLDTVKFPILYGWGRLVCKYNRNTEAALPGTSAADKLVAEFYSYDLQGRVTKTAKYLGPIRDATFKRQAAWYQYDESNRLTSLSALSSAYASTVSSYHSYKYDELGRIRRIEDLNLNRVAEFTYTNWGPLQSAYLGGSGTSSGTRVDYAYHIQGQLKEIKATQLGTNKVVFQQLLGYESKVNSAGGVPGLIEQRWDGTITQQLTKLTGDLSGSGVKPVRLVNYDFDELGRMLQAKTYTNSNATPLDGNENINFAALTTSQDAVLSTSLDYDLNGRITGQRTGGASAADSARYFYDPASNKLDRVTGKLSSASTRNLSAAGTLQYDAAGNLTRDASKNLTVTYDWWGMPVKTATGTVSQFQYYDADGHRAAHVEAQGAAGSEKRVSGTYYVILDGLGLKEWRETYASDGSTVSLSQEICSLLGKSGPVGRAYKSGSSWQANFYLRNIQGSVIRLVGQDGNFASQNAYDYMPYGDPKTLKSVAGVPSVTERFTGKEYDDLYRLYAFGARFFDPELGIWISPDPAGQFAYPYGFGGDPINYLDPTGLWSIGLGLVVGYDKHGFHIGAGASVDVDLGAVGVDVNASYTWSGDGSRTGSLGVGAQVQVGIVGLEAGLGGSHNTMDGYLLNLHVGANILVVGAEIGTNQAWDVSGNYLGGNVYGEGYLGVKGLASAGAGYEVGWGGFRTGAYFTATLLLNNWSDHGGGWNYDGFQQTFSVASFTSKSEKNRATLLTDHSDNIGHSAIKGVYEGEKFTISVGPGSKSVGLSPKGILNFLLPQAADENYETHAATAKKVDLRGLDIGKLYQFAKFIQAVGVPYEAFTACSFYTSAAIFYAGGFSVGGNFHPFAIEAQMKARKYTNL